MSEKYSEEFNNLDTNKVGHITKQQFKKAIFAFIETANKFNDKEFDLLFKKVDTNGDGTIDLQEYSVLKQEIELIDIRQQFEYFDSDGNGFITKKELQTELTKLGHKLNRKQIDEMFDSVDTDGSGTLDFNEFKAMMLSSNSKN